MRQAVEGVGSHPDVINSENLSPSFLLKQGRLQACELFGGVASYGPVPPSPPKARWTRCEAMTMKPAGEPRPRRKTERLDAD